MFKSKIEGSLDIGCSSVKGLLLKNKVIEKLDMEPVAHGAILSGAIEDHLAVTESIKRVVNRLGLKGKSVAVSIPIQNFFLKFIEISKVSEKERMTLIEAELEDLVPGYSAMNYVTQYVILESPSTGKDKMAVMTIQKDKVNTLIELLTSAKVKPVKIVPDFIGLFNLFEVTKHEVIKNLEHASIMVVDIGSEATKVFVNKDGEFKMHRIAPVGGNDFNDVVQRLQNIEFEPAEIYKYKLELKNDSEEEENEEIFNEIGDLVEELNGQIKRSIEYYRIQEGTIGIDEMIITGGGSLLKGYKEVLEKKMSMAIKDFPTVRFLSKKINNKEFLESSLKRFDVVIGNIVDEVTK